jgi:hypothetical protein
MLHRQQHKIVRLLAFEFLLGQFLAWVTLIPSVKVWTYDYWGDMA